VEIVENLHQEKFEKTPLLTPPLRDKKIVRLTKKFEVFSAVLIAEDGSVHIPG